MGGRGIGVQISAGSRDFVESKQGLGSTFTPIQRVLGIKGMERETDHSSPSAADGTNG
jgi:hypothetical protein